MTQDVGTTKRGRLTSRDRREIWEREAGHCMVCHCKLQTGRFIFEHVVALELGGADHRDNIRLTCLACAKEKTRDDHIRAGHAKRQKIATLGLKAPSLRPLPCGKRSPYRKRIDGTVVPRRQP